MTVVTFVVLAVLPGCVPGCAQKEPLPEHLKSFFSQHVSKQEKAFTTLALEDQFTVYIHARTRRHPPSQTFDFPFTKRGSEIVPFLMEKLREENGREDVSPLRQESIIRLFGWMVRFHKYDLRDNEELLTLLEETIQAMEPGPLKGFCSDWLSIIKAGPKEKRERPKIDIGDSDNLRKALKRLKPP